MRHPTILVTFLLAHAAGLAAAGVPELANSCADGPHVGPFPLPLTTAPFALTEANFDLTGAGCSNTAGINDAVLCFAPENDCTVDIACDWTPSPLHGADQYLNLIGGPCSHAPASCLAWNTEASNTRLEDVAVVAGQRYCVVCQDTLPGRWITVSISAVAGNCGLIDTSIFEDGFESGDTTSWSVSQP